MVNFALEQDPCAKELLQSPKDLGSSDKGNDDALALVGCAQTSTVFKCGPERVARFAGTHVALCGHTMHDSCCEAYLPSVVARDGPGTDRLERKGEFWCPLCQRLSNCLVPYVEARATADEGTKEEDDGINGMEINGDNDNN